jgi:hypothetical protein
MDSYDDIIQAYLNVPLRSLEDWNSSVHILICNRGILL